MSVRRQSLRLILVLSCCLPLSTGWGMTDPEVFSGETPPRDAEKPARILPGEERIDLDTLFPQDKRVFGWARMYDESIGYGDWQLDQILGIGADLYREYDVEEMRSLDYALGEAEISIELFRTGSPDGAFGLYSIFNAALEEAETPVITNVIPQRAGEATGTTSGEVRVTNQKLPPLVGDNYRVYQGQGAEFFKGRVYGRIRVFGDINDTHMLAMCVDMLERIPRDAPRPPILRDLPKPGVLSNSHRYVVGPISAQELNFPVPADLWGLKGSARAASARYRFGASEYYDVLVVKYGNPAWASSRYNAVRDFLSADANFQSFAASNRLPQPFTVVKDVASDSFVGLHQQADVLVLYADVENSGMFDRIATTGLQISVREP